jgi:hypothetical protein
MKKWLIGLTITALSAYAAMVKDPRTGLLWEDTPHTTTKITHPKAQAYCRDLKLGGYDDWRLPTVKELLSIVDYTRYKPALPTAFAYVEEEGFYWSSTVYADDSDEYWGVNFKDGASSEAAEYYDRYVRCVRTYGKK